MINVAKSIIKGRKESEGKAREVRLFKSIPIQHITLSPIPTIFTLFRVLDPSQLRLFPFNTIKRCF